MISIYPLYYRSSRRIFHHDRNIIVGTAVGRAFLMEVIFGRYVLIRSSKLELLFSVLHLINFSPLGMCIFNAYDETFQYSLERLSSSTAQDKGRKPFCAFSQEKAIEDSTSSPKSANSVLFEK
jgi:hypothetical protein